MKGCAWLGRSLRQTSLKRWRTLSSTVTSDHCLFRAHSKEMLSKVGPFRLALHHMIRQQRIVALSKLFRFVPILTSLEVSPFFDFVLVVCCFVGLARSVALRSPKGGALRAKRKARPTTVASPPRAASRRAAPPSGGRLPATDDWPLAPTCAWLSAHAARGFAAPPGRSWLARGFPASVAHDRDTRWRCGRAALRTPTLCCALARSCDFAARVGKTGSRSAPPSLR